MTASRSSRHQSLLGDPSPTELRKTVNDLVSDVRQLRAALTKAEARIAALEKAG